MELAAVAREAVAAVRVVDPGRPLTLRADEGVVVYGDAEQLRRVVDNLLANVRSHTPAGTPAHVRVRTVPAAPLRDGRRPNRDVMAVLEVADEGPGIAAEALSRVFDRFYRADPAHSGDGSGLGLAIVAAVAQSHAGTVDLSSEVGGGTRVSVHLPPASPER